MIQPISKASEVAMIGAGAMGAGIAQVAAACGHPVRLFDVRAGAADKALADIGKAYGKLVEKGRMDAAEAELARGRLQAVPGLSGVSGAMLVIEAVLEDLEVKRRLFAELEEIVADDCILATNTSSISVTAIAAPLRVPGRLIGMHFFNPAPLMALVEVVSGLATDRAVADIAFATAASWGKEPVHAASTPGFIVNRVARPYYGEALRLLSERAADPATIDAVMRDCGGFRMGPFELMDLIGLDVNLTVTKAVFNGHFGDPRFTPSIIQQELVNAGFLGRKAGRGFYRYGEDASKAQPQVEPSQPHPSKLVLSMAPDAAGEAIERRLEAAGVKVERRHALEPGFRCNAAAILLTDGRTATERAFETRQPDTVLYDLLLDPVGATRVAPARADQCGDTAWKCAVGLFQAAGFAVTRIDDVPGMVVMRTVAMLANEAADAVNQGVCSAGAVDVAMRKGVNYPRGPLAWADEIGLARTVTVLANLAAMYGEDRYRVSPLLRRMLVADPDGARFHA